MTMATERGETSNGQIVPAAPRGLAVRSAALVARGLRDLARHANWLTTKLFAGQSPNAAVSCRGQVCAVAPQVKGEPQRLVVYDIDRGAAALALAVPNEAVAFGSQLAKRAAFSWSPSAQFLVAAWGLWEPALHLFDLQNKMFIGAFGEFAEFPRCTAFSPMGRYFAAGGAGPRASLELWTAQPGQHMLAGPAIGRIGPPVAAEPQNLEDQSSGEGTFAGYGRIAFSPDERIVAAVVEIKGEWADDSILFAELPAFERQRLFPAEGHITDLTWAPGNRTMIYCSAGQAYRIAAGAGEAQQLPFGAELACCHPHRPLCVCFSSWLRNSAKGRLFLFDLDTMDVLDEHPAENVADLRWSCDGSKAYAVTRDGLAYTYDPPF
jgi:WD40 repeat protein